MGGVSAWITSDPEASGTFQGRENLGQGSRAAVNSASQVPQQLEPRK